MSTHQDTAEIRLQLQGIVKRFQDRSGTGMVHAVDDVSLEIRAGEFITLLGPSGCGKTTTLRLIAGFELPTSGRILLDGKDITGYAPNKRDMALVFQNYALFPHMTVFDNVAYGLQTPGRPRAEITQRTNNALTMIGLTGMEKRRPNQLSGGQQQRVALARSLVMEPRILLFDEPLSNLDAKLRVQMRSEIHRLQRRLGITSIYVTHDQVEAMALSDRVVVMNKGKIDQIGTPEVIYRTPATRFVADFIGRANFIESVPCQLKGDAAEVQLLGRTITVPRGFAPQSSGRATAMLRPEALILRAEDPALPIFTIEQTMYLGSEVEYIVQGEGISLVVVEQNPRASRIFPEGMRVGLDFETDAVHLLP
jgi:iron(III) transport system ATP-binding protein